MFWVWLLILLVAAITFLLWRYGSAQKKSVGEG
jgi:hypothetical protein